MPNTENVSRIVAFRDFGDRCFDAPFMMRRGGTAQARSVPLIFRKALAYIGKE
jgi:hypothetical protein